MRKKTIIIAAAISSAIACVTLAGFVVLVSPADAKCCRNLLATKLAAKPRIPAPIVGEFTGTYADGLPVYRLPPVTIVVDRKAELARIEREEQLARANPDRAQLATASPSQP